MESGLRRQYRKLTDAAVDIDLVPGASFRLIDVTFVLETAATTSESATIQVENEDGDVMDQISADDGDLSTYTDETTIIFRFDKNFMAGDTIKIDYANTAAHCDDIVVLVRYDVQDLVASV